MKMEKRKFRIGELAQNLGIKNFVIRFWEKEFNIEPDRSEGKQRFYNEADLEKFKLIKKLLYEKKFTLEGAKTELKNKSKEIIPSQITTFNNKTTDLESTELVEFDVQKTIFASRILELRKQLIKLKELL